MARFMVIHPIAGLPDGQDGTPGRTVNLDPAVSGQLVEVGALELLDSDEIDEEVITASPLAQGDEPAETTGTAATKAPAKASRKK